jgi:hypothetical protein
MEYRMSNESKNANVAERGSSEKTDTTQKSRQQSQDESRHQQDAAHHKNDKRTQQGSTDS